ncbi:MraY family glycosyltransferase [Flavobacterium algicola]|uniref:MraY family glycosyltransferase n=1 Tax=Flavobacterium algicola TaxID=556529 RepID=UPI001EFD2FB9|nr:glycosyltransferase family 4 protein [Flavobacterium algicola]MCG9793920.1 glycosyltransferase family 4 protein [Flavobacterium algicola]
MIYLIVFALLLIMELVFFKIADKYNIIDKPNHRSSHTEITLRGGGIIYWFAALLYFVQNVQDNYLFFIGITIVSVISFWDDIQSLSSKIRFFSHLVAISFLFWNLDLYAIVPIYGILLAYFFFVGSINAYNFMDGINGITGLQSISILSALWFVNNYVITYAADEFILYPIIASVVFLIFNFRKKAKCFAGDIGSIAVAFWILFLISNLMIASQSILWIMLLAVYGAETGLTILHRIYLKEKLSEAHRWHFYQILCNEYKIDHRIVSLGYALLQAIVSILVIWSYQKISDWLIILILFTPLFLLYSIKFYLLDKLENQI